MPAYLIGDIAISDLAAYEEYKAKTPAIIARHGGEYLVRGGSHEILEGRWSPTRLVLLSFPDRDALHAFLDDPDYAPLKALRARIAKSDIVAVDGIG